MLESITYSCNFFIFIACIKKTRFHLMFRSFNLKEKYLTSKFLTI